jgi:hypothetical protein
LFHSEKENIMATKPTNSIVAQIADAHQLITNSLTVTEILDLVTGFGFNAEKLNKGLTLVTAAQAAANEQTIKAGAQKLATQTFLEAQTIARDAYQALAKLARAIYLHDPAKLSALGLDAPAPKATSAFLTSAFTLFDNAATLRALSGYGYDTVKLASERAKIAAMRDADDAQEIAKGEAQQATVAQESALDAMNDWVAQYRKVARIALRGKKQLLEQIGVLARSSKTAAQRAAPAKSAATRAANKEQG